MSFLGKSAFFLSANKRYAAIGGCQNIQAGNKPLDTQILPTEVLSSRQSPPPSMQTNKKISMKEYGARPLRRAITHLIEDPLADAILGGKLERGQVAYLDIKGTTVSVTVRQPRGVPTLKSGIVAKPAAVKTRVGEGVKVRS